MVSPRYNDRALNFLYLVGCALDTEKTNKQTNIQLTQNSQNMAMLILCVQCTHVGCMTGICTGIFCR